jgi:predicted nucleotidyltransferase
MIIEKRDSALDRRAIIENLEEYYANQNKAVFVYLFGSHAKGMDRENSDIDIAVYLDSVTDKPYEYKIEETIRLQDLLKKRVDLIILNHASPILANQVFRYGVPVKGSKSRQLSDFRVANFYKYLDQVNLTNKIFNINKNRIMESVKNG